MYTLLLRSAERDSRVLLMVRRNSSSLTAQMTNPAARETMRYRVTLH